MKRNELQELLSYSQEIKKLLWKTSECKKGACYACNYNDICEAISLFEKLVGFKIDREIVQRIEKEGNQK